MLRRTGKKIILQSIIRLISVYHFKLILKVFLSKNIEENDHSFPIQSYYFPSARTVLQSAPVNLCLSIFLYSTE